MYPVLLQFHAPLLGDVVFPAYFTLLTFGFTLATVLAMREARRVGINEDRILDLALWMALLGVIGARVFHLAFDGHFHEYVDLCVDPTRVPAVDALVTRCTTDAQCGYGYLCDLSTQACHPPRDCLRAIKVWYGGLVYYGGLLFAMTFAAWYLRRHRLSYLRVGDVCASGIALGLFFGRMGCFLNGCCFGRVCSIAAGVVFPRGSDAWRKQVDAGIITRAMLPRPVIPTELYEALGCLAIFGVLRLALRPRQRHEGQALGAFLALYAALRFVLEIFRDDDRGVFFHGLLSTSQIVSLPLFALGVWLWARPRRRALSLPATA